MSTANFGFGQLTNGGLSTGATSNSGVAAPTGYTWSEAQNDVGNNTESNTSAGFACTATIGTSFFFLADDFVVPAGQQWQISSVEVFAYQTGYTGATSPFSTLRINILNGSPTAGGTSVFGDDTTNRFASSSDAMMYRLFNSAVPAPGSTVGTTRRIWKIVGNASTTLNAGTYWLKWQLENSTIASGGFAPPATIKGTRTVAGLNAKQYASSTSSWSDIIDGGNPATAPDVAMDMPFVINYVNLLGTGEVLQYDNRVVVYPNPVKDEFRLNLPQESNHKKTSISIYDMSGKLIKKMPISESYDVSELKKGLYLIYVNDGSHTKVTKMIKN